jgi:hypothetical protein
MNTQLDAADDTAWRRKLASGANNRAWTLSEQLTRTAAEDQEMLNAAHASAHLWSTIGNDKNIAVGHLLLGQVHALLGNASYAVSHASSAFDRLTRSDSDPWEVAIAHAVMANASNCAGNVAQHQLHYATADKLIAALADPEEREIVQATMRVVPKPDGNSL